MLNSESLSDFLKGSEQISIVKSAINTNGSNQYCYVYLVKINSGIKKLDLIYQTRLIKNIDRNIINPFYALNLLGIYDNANDILYYENISRYEPLISKVNKIPIVSIEEELIQNVRKEIINRIGYDEKFIPNSKIDEKHLNNIKKGFLNEAKRLFLFDKTIEKYSYANWYPNEAVDLEKLVLPYINNPQETIKSEADNFIKKQSLNIFYDIIKNKAIEKEMERMKDDKNCIQNKKILSILSSKDKETVNVEFGKDKKTLTCKLRVISNPNWRTYYNNEYISDNEVVKNKEGFNEMFKDQGPASFKDIKKITYGKKTLYQKN